MRGKRRVSGSSPDHRPRVHRRGVDEALHAAYCTAVIADEAAQHPEARTPSRVPSLLELDGLGAEIWLGVEAGDYVRKLRDEWDRPSPVPRG